MLSFVSSEVIDVSSFGHDHSIRQKLKLEEHSTVIWTHKLSDIVKYILHKLSILLSKLINYNTNIKSSIVLLSILFISDCDD